MPPSGPLHLVVVADPSTPIDPLMKRLSSAEQEQARQRPSTARRHFVLGRLAAHAAIRRAVGAGPDCAVEVATGPEGEPQALMAEAPGTVSVSISHVSRMAAACAWQSGPGYAAGLDLERVRSTRVAESAYAFSRRERTLLSRAPEGPSLAGLAGWALKEAVWKALWPCQPPSPASVEIRALNLSSGRATVGVNGWLTSRPGGGAIQARLRMVAGPDGHYVMAIAEIGVLPPRDEDPTVAFREATAAKP